MIVSVHFGRLTGNLFYIQILNLDEKKAVLLLGAGSYFSSSTTDFTSDCGSRVGSGLAFGCQEMRMCLNHIELHDSSMWY